MDLASLKSEGEIVLWRNLIRFAIGADPIVKKEQTPDGVITTISLPKHKEKEFQRYLERLLNKKPAPGDRVKLDIAPIVAPILAKKYGAYAGGSLLAAFAAGKFL